MKKWFPQYLAQPFMVLSLEPDEQMLIITGLLMAFTIGGWYMWVLLFMGPYVYIRAKKKYPRGFFKHILYFFGLTKLEGYPTYHERDFVE